MKRRKEKKSESLDIRLPFEQKREFMEATRKRGETASSALRRFIATYIEEARLAEQPNPVQEITMTLARHRFKSIATAAGAALGVFSVTALPSAADAKAFDALDKNNDGMITEGEILPGEDADIIARLDTDGSGGVSREELAAAGNRIVIQKTSTDGEEEGQTVTRKTVKILEFSDNEDGEIRGEVSTNVEKRVVVKRIDGGDELSKAELSALLEQALDEAGVEDHGDVDVDIMVDQIVEEIDEAEE